MTRRTGADGTGRGNHTRGPVVGLGMTLMRAARPGVAVALLVGVAACAERGGGTGSGAPATPSPAAATEGLVLRVDLTGGFAPPTVLAGRLPVVSVYADGRVITEGPVAAIYPGPALPNLQVRQIDRAAVQDLVDRAMDAGVAETADLGSPPVADATSTRFTLVTASDTYVREAYALSEAPAEGTGLTQEQQAPRSKLGDLMSPLTDTAAGQETTPYAPDTVAVLVTPWSDPQDGL